jgi:hypothetical protein
LLESIVPFGAATRIVRRRGVLLDHGDHRVTDDAALDGLKRRRTRGRTGNRHDGRGLRGRAAGGEVVGESPLEYPRHAADLFDLEFLGGAGVALHAGGVVAEADEEVARLLGGSRGGEDGQGEQSKGLGDHRYVASKGMGQWVETAAGGYLARPEKSC